MPQPPDGSEHKRPPLPRREGAFRLGNVDLGPAERLRHQLLLDEWASFTIPGKYGLDVATCERLVQQVESTNNVGKMNDAALALAHVDDPIVVPYLERALRSGKYVGPG